MLSQELSRHRLRCNSYDTSNLQNSYQSIAIALGTTRSCFLCGEQLAVKHYCAAGAVGVAHDNPGSVLTPGGPPGAGSGLLSPSVPCEQGADTCARTSWMGDTVTTSPLAPPSVTSIVSPLLSTLRRWLP